MRRLAVLCTLLFSLQAGAQSVRTIARLDSLFDALESSSQMLGSVAVSKGDRVFYTRSVGRAYERTSIPVSANAETMYRIGSITKMFTATLVMKAVEEGKLTLDTRLGAFYPEVPNADRITIAQLLSHRTGLHNYTADSNFSDYRELPQTEAQMLTRIRGSRPDFPPDSTFAYSNTNYYLLGGILQKVRGLPYAELVQRTILAPLGMKRTRVGTEISNAGNEASSFEWENGGWRKQAPWSISAAGAAGSITSTPSDLLRFANALFAGRLVQPATLAQMQKTTAIPGRRGAGYGLGMFQMPFGARKAWMHNGGIEGFHSSLAYFPDDSIALAIVLNGARYDLNNLNIGILSAVYDLPFQIPDFNRKKMVLADTVLQRYTGTYFSKDFPLKFFVRAEEGKLIARPTGQSPFGLEALSETEFQFEDAGIQMRFAPGADGKWGTMHFDQKGYKAVFTKE